MGPHLHVEVHRPNIDVGGQDTILSDLDGVRASLADPFYSLHDGSDNRVSGGSSK